jgi:hypothetical protein
MSQPYLVPVIPVTYPQTQVIIRQFSIQEQFIGNTLNTLNVSPKSFEHIYNMISNGNSILDIKKQIIFYVFKSLIHRLLLYIVSYYGTNVIIKGSYGLKMLLNNMISLNKADPVKYSEFLRLYYDLTTQDLDLDLILDDISKYHNIIDYVNDFIITANYYI